MRTACASSGAAVLLAALALGACSSPTPSPSSQTAPASAAAPTSPAGTPAPPSRAFTPPAESSIPNDEFGAMVRKGEAIFTHTRANAGEYVGNDLNCSNCHLDAGRRANSAPLWAAYGRYPRYRSKNHKVNTFAERLQGCFRYSMNGKAPPVDGDIIKALTTYSYWLATGAPVGKELPGVGYPTLKEPSKAPDYARGERVYQSDCALCHGADGQGQQAAGATVFPPLWGDASFNWGAGMHSVNNAAGFIKANMPYSRGDTLTDQEAWDVAYYMDAHERPQDPRFTGNVATTRQKFHDSKWSLYGKEVNGHLLGSGAPAAGHKASPAPPRS